ncbi:AraC family transcriptional regulator [Caulobacter mirabilis]|uniref:AraC family transcriptional regulator n=1 Tax=Caulobacter mirabilis TaxID=69666 RepID=A0A2D2AUN6_9CAUL|nr:AraC family transcriptional regulator [Caulobacter mirabilis]ATQ41719.1 AraC family transcriptional regulator [Caulobacter mirabilis]
MAEPTVSAGLAKGFLDFAVTRGAEARALGERSGVTAADLSDHDGRLPMARYVALVRAAKDLTGDPALPLRFAEAVDMSEVSIVGLLTNASETMMEAFAQLNRYGRLVAEVDLGAESRFRLDVHDGGFWMIDTRDEPNAFPEMTETTFARLTCGPRRFLPRPHVLEVHVTHSAPVHRTEYDRIFQCPVRFDSDWNAMRLDPTLTTHRVQLQPRYVFGVLSAHADALMANLEASKSVRGRVESLLMPILHTGQANMDLIARRMGLSRQTLYRKLKAEDATFERVLDDLRRRLALHYLGGKRASVNETAYLVGFSEPAAFSRAFKRWTGDSPRAARFPET